MGLTDFFVLVAHYNVFHSIYQHTWLYNPVNGIYFFYYCSYLRSHSNPMNYCWQCIFIPTYSYHCVCMNICNKYWFIDSCFSVDFNCHWSLLLFYHCCKFICVCMLFFRYKSNININYLIKTHILWHLSLFYHQLWHPSKKMFQ